MNAEEMVKTWAARKLNVPVDRVASVHFAHECGWTSDSGTFWPEENYAVVSLWSANTRDRRASAQEDRQIDIDAGVNGFQTLLQQIIDVASQPTSTGRSSSAVPGR